MPRRRTLDEQIRRIQAGVARIDRLLRAASRFDVRAVATLAQVEGALHHVSAEIVELMANLAARAPKAPAKRKGES